MTSLSANQQFALLLIGEVRTLFVGMAWPVSVLVIVWLMRHQLRGLLTRLEKASGAGFEATFAAETDRIQSYLAESQTELELKRDARAERMRDAYDAGVRYSLGPTPAQEASDDPIRNVGLALNEWQKIERAVDELFLESDGPLEPKYRSLRSKTSFLVKAGRLQPATRDAVQALSHLRNLVVHAPGGGLDKQKTIEFVTLAEVVRELLEP